MKKNNLLIIPAILCFALLGASVVNYSAEAAINKGRLMQNKQNTEINYEQRQAERTAKQEAEAKAIAANNYEAWLAAVGADCPMAKKINKDNFHQLVELRNLQKLVQEKAKALGLERNGSQKGMRHNFNVGQVK